ncbi:MAG: ATP-grasp domain-containing protein, partial [Pseudomonadota bacterium]
MRKLRVAMLVHWSLIPPEDIQSPDDPRIKKCNTEYDVKTALLKLGHEVRIIGVWDELSPIRKIIEEWKPHICFNLLEDFAGNSALDYYVVSYLEMLKVPYTGCNPRGLLLGRDKALSKKILTYHRIAVPDFMVFTHRQKIGRLRKLPYPMFIKSLTEEGSVGIAQASYVENEQQLRERVAKLHEMTKGDVIAEQYIDGREFYVTVLGNQRLDVFPVRELVFDKVPEGQPRIATFKVKWNDEYRERWGIEYVNARPMPAGMQDRIVRLCKRIYRTLDLSGYARIDLRVDAKGDIYVLEANPNPAVARNDECAASAEKAGLKYEDFIQRLLTLGLAA